MNLLGIWTSRLANSGKKSITFRFFVLLIGTAILPLSRMNAVQTSDYAVQVSVQTGSSPPQIKLLWLPDSSGATTNYLVSRKTRDATAWEAALTLAGTETSYTDTNVAVGIAYEYQVQRIAPGFAGYGYVYAGIEVPAVESRGRVTLVVDNSYAAELNEELTRLEEDLVGDGWAVTRHDVDRHDSVANVKALIKADYTADPANARSVFLLGHVPVPYSGSIAPDGHTPEHLGAWPADAFYADTDGSWTDTRINVVSASSARQFNTTGDGKYDQPQIPTRLKLQLGRVDLSDLPAFAFSE